ncbi:MAG: hypothetical protein PHE17_14905 [Thiothrix sp.]|nr:hypothetical protein [Thiothrix sp.]
MKGKRSGRGSNLVSVNSKYSIPDAMREPVGYKACWICPTQEDSIVFIRNIKAVATRLGRMTACYRYKVPRHNESHESMRITLQLIANGQIQPEDISSDWMVVMEITA